MRSFPRAWSMCLVLALKRECTFIARKPMHYVIPFLFFMLVCLLFPLAISADSQVLTMVGAGVVWVAVLLAHLLALPHLFSEDYEDGSLDQLLIRPTSLSNVLSAKIFVHWLFFIFPMILIAPALALIYHIPLFATKILILGLLLGTPIIAIQGAIVGALCVGLRRDGLLLAIILLPMYIPTMIFGTTGVVVAAQGMSVLFQLDILGALLMMAIAFGPSVTAFALRIGITYG